MRVVVAISILVAGCNRGAPPAAATIPPPSRMPYSAIPGVYAKACVTECADELAQLVTYRDAKGGIAIVSVQGSPARCSDPPLRFLGPDGVERAAIPMQPVVSGSDDAKRFDQIRAHQLDGLTKSETMYCRDVKH